MDMTGEYRIPASRQKVWEALNDPEILRQAIPGCETLAKTADNQFEAKVKAKVGPVSATFNGKVTLSDLVPPESYKISGEGSGGVAGFAKGGAVVNLAEDGPTATILTYNANADVGGKLAQIGSRLIAGTAKKMADEFFSNFSGLVPSEAPPAEAVASVAAQPAPSTTAAAPAAPPTRSAPVAPATSKPAPAVTDYGNNPLVWIGAIVVILLLLFLILR